MPTWIQTLQNIGFSLDAASHIATGQNIQLEDFVDLDEVDITVICNAVRKPGGEIIRGTRRIPNPGTSVSALAEKRLKLLRFMVKHYSYQINRTLTNDLITKENLSSMSEFKKIEESYKDSESVVPINTTTEMVEFLNNVDDKLFTYRGCKGAPLSYLIRKNIVPVAENIDPPTNYSTVQEQIVARAPHVSLVNGILTNTLSYTTDNHRLASLLRKMTETNTTAKTWSDGRKKDGRAIIQTWIGHYQGTSKVESQMIQAEEKMKKLSYTMEGHRYNFEKYTTLHRMCHNQINSANKALTPPLPPLLERVKVQHYLAGIQAPGMTAAMAAVRASVTLKSDFDQCSDYLSTFVIQTNSQTRSVAAVGQGGEQNPNNTNNGRGGRGGQPNRNKEKRSNGDRIVRKNLGGKGQGGRYKRGSTNIEDRYYTVAEYNKLSKEQKQILYDKRHGTKKVRFEDQIRAASTTKSNQTSEISYIASLVRNDISQRMQQQNPTIPPTPQPNSNNVEPPKITYPSGWPKF